MSAYVVALQLKGRRALVVGQGFEATDKCLKLIAAGAEVTLVAPDLDAVLRAPVEAGRLRHTRREFDPDLDLWPRPMVVLSVADTPEAHERVVQPAREAGILVCAVDSPTQCDFFHTAMGPIGPMTIAVATNGKAPALGRRLRDELVRQLDGPLGLFADALASLRASADPAGRRALISRALDGFSLEVRLTLPAWLDDPSKLTG